MIDKLGTKLVVGDKVTMTGEIVADGEDGRITVKIDTNNGESPLVQVKPAFVTKQGDSSTLEAARRGFNSAFDK
jgi:hypothetical protein